MEEGGLGRGGVLGRVAGFVAGGERVGVVVGWELALGQLQLRGEGMQ